MRCARNLPLNDAEDFVELFHEIAFVLQSARSIADEYIHVPLLGSLNGIEHHRSRVRTGLLLDDIHTCTLSPDLQLLNGPRTESIASGEQNLFALLFIAVCQFANGGCLADTIYANEQNNSDAVRVLLQTVVIIPSKQLHQLPGQNRLQLGSILDALLLHFRS
ncbi:hypothetical protein D3C76_332730 [compost metagenome]